MAMSGAPRTCMRRMTPQASSLPATATYVVSCGTSSWSSTSSVFADREYFRDCSIEEAEEEEEAAIAKDVRFLNRPKTEGQ